MEERIKRPNGKQIIRIRTPIKCGECGTSRNYETVKGCPVCSCKENGIGDEDDIYDEFEED